MTIIQIDPKKLKAFVDELSGFAKEAELSLSEIEKDLLGNRSKFSFFSEAMFTIRGTTLQLDLPKIAELAGFAEEIALKAVTADTRPQVRKCVGALWDALTTIKFLIENYQSETSEEQDILVNRLQATLKALGGAREKISIDEIEALLKSRS